MVEEIKKEDSENTVSKQSRTRGLIPFKKGQSGNPKGKPAGSVSITAAIKIKLLEMYPEQKQAEITGDDGKKVTNKEKRTYLEKIIETVFHNAIAEKDQRALNQIWAYIDGHPKATIDIGVDKTQLDELTKFFRIAAKPKNKK